GAELPLAAVKPCRSSPARQDARRGANGSVNCQFAFYLTPDFAKSERRWPSMDSTCWPGHLPLNLNRESAPRSVRSDRHRLLLLPRAKEAGLRRIYTLIYSSIFYYTLGCPRPGPIGLSRSSSSSLFLGSTPSLRKRPSLRKSLSYSILFYFSLPYSIFS